MNTHHLEAIYLTLHDIYLFLLKADVARHEALKTTQARTRKVRSDKGKPRPQSKGKAGRPRTRR